MTVVDGLLGSLFDYIWFFFLVYLSLSGFDYFLMSSFDYLSQSSRLMTNLVSFLRVLSFNVDYAELGIATVPLEMRLAFPQRKLIYDPVTRMKVEFCIVVAGQNTNLQKRLRHTVSL